LKGYPLGDPPGVLVTDALIIPERNTDEGVLVTSNTAALFALIEKLGSDWPLAYQIEPRTWEELMAAAYSECGYEVTLTPRSGDHGRDLIAEKKGRGCIRLLNQVKRFGPDYLVTADMARAMLGVLAGDAAASKAVITTTSSFAPKILDDPAIQGAYPTRLQLIDGAELQKLFEEFGRGKPVL
jgi:restriction system protein